jgi:hypothetical protein
MKSKPSSFMRAAFLVIGCTFLAIGFLFGAWMLVPFGLLALFVGGIETRIRPNTEGRELLVESSSWGMKYLTRRFDVDAGSLLVLVLYPAGSQSGDGISLSNSSAMFLESSHGRRHRLGASSDFMSFSRSAEELAASLKIKLKKEEMA